MRIISKFHDYYDATLSQGYEDDRVYVRHEQLIENAFQRTRGPSGSQSSLSSELEWTRALGELAPSGTRFVFKSQGHEVSAGWVLFAGRLYPYARVRTLPGRAFSVYSGSAEACISEFYAYDFQTLEEWAQARDESFEPKKPKYRAWLPSPALSWPNFFALHGSDRWHALATEHRLPIVAWDRRSGDMRLHGGLKPLQFFRCLDAWQAYQELAMFVGNLSLPQGNVCEIADKYRLEQHGFDEWSFRKPSAQPSR